MIKNQTLGKGFEMVVTKCVQQKEFQRFKELHQKMLIQRCESN